MNKQEIVTMSYLRAQAPQCSKWHSPAIWLKHGLVEVTTHKVAVPLHIQDANSILLSDVITILPVCAIWM